MFSYRKIVFGIKHKFQISDVLKIFKQQRCCSVMISQHNAFEVDDYCDRPDLHYHGLVEFSNEGKNEDFFQDLARYCTYFRNDECNQPVEYLAFMTLSPKRKIAQEILNASKLQDYLRTALSTKSEVLSRKMERKITLMERNTKVIKFVEIILKSGYNIVNHVKNKEWYLKWLHENNEMDGILSKEAFKTAMQVSLKIILNSSILVLTNRFECQNGYLSPEESAQFVLDWCSFQNLDPKEFTKNLIHCLDKRGGNRNSIYLQGSSNSGKAYIVRSIIEACIHVGHAMLESTAYPYVWEKCVEKRLIVLGEPYFSTINFDQLDKILSGSGTLIFKHNDVVDYLQPTPVIIMAKEHDWTDDTQLSEKIKKRFLCYYMDLKHFPNMLEKKLHPRWLNILNKTFSRKNNIKTVTMNTKTADSKPLKSLNVINRGIKITEGHLNDDKEKASSSSLKISQDHAPFSPPVSRNKTKVSGSENAKQPDPKQKKRPMIDTEHGRGKNKMKRVDVIDDY